MEAKHKCLILMHAYYMFQTSYRTRPMDPWRIMRVSKGLITMVIVSPLRIGVFPFQMTELHGFFSWRLYANYLRYLKNPILQVGWIRNQGNPSAIKIPGS